MKKKMFLFAVAGAFALQMSAQRLVVRMDDLGGSHAINEAIIKCYQEGIGRSTEIMVPTPWFLEGARMANENPGLDVGLHVTLFSEWKEYKWRPLTHCPSLCDEDGYFFPNFDPKRTYDPQEVEAEIRAQIELAKKYVKNLTHISIHMGATPLVQEILAKLSTEYGLPEQPGPELNVDMLGFVFRKPGTSRAGEFLELLKKAEKGKTYWTIEHPGFDVPEMEGMFTRAGEDVGEDRQDVTNTFTDPAILQYIRDNGIELISFGDILRENKNK